MLPVALQMMELWPYLMLVPCRVVVVVVVGAAVEEEEWKDLA